MPTVGEIAWHVSGDIGGTGVSRFRFTRQDAGNITGADCNAAAAAVKGIFTAAAPFTPSTVVWTCVSQVNVYDVASGLVQGPLTVTSLPSGVTGTGSGGYAGGSGGRINWKTSTLSGRRLLKGATYLIPMSQNSFTVTGALGGSTQTPINAALATYINAMTTAQLYPVIWHRPLKGATSGGLTGIVYAASLSATPSSLRSRRH